MCVTDYSLLYAAVLQLHFYSVLCSALGLLPSLRYPTGGVLQETVIPPSPLPLLRLHVPVYSLNS